MLGFSLADFDFPVVNFQLFVFINYSGPEGVTYHERRQLPPAAELWLARVRARKIQPHLRPGDAVFEYGVGFGWNLMALNCARKCGHDIAPGLAEIALSRGIEFAPPDQLPAGSFDAVLCHHTLEHLRAPADALAAMHRLLKPGGKLILFVPYEKERKYRRFRPHDKAHHLYSWTPSSLANLVCDCGFSVQSAGLRRFRFDRAAAVLTLKLRLNETACRIIRRIGLALLPEYEISLTALRPAPESHARSQSQSGP